MGPRQLGFIAVALVVLSVVAVPVVEALIPLLKAGAVLALALAGLWIIATAPFRNRL